MAEVGATHPGRLASNPGHGGWRKRDFRLLNRIRRPLVTAILIVNDIAVALVAISMEKPLLELMGLQDPHAGGPRIFALPLLLLAFLAVGLYSGSGPSPYERFRLRTIGITGFVVIDFLVALPAGEPLPLLVAAAAKAISLLVLGHYMEALIRTILIQLHMWGAPTAVVGCGEKSLILAHLLRGQPDLGLTPIGFIATPDDEEPYKAQLPLPLLGTTADAKYGCAVSVEVVIFGSAEELAGVTGDPKAWMPSCQLLFVENAHDLQSLWLRTRMLGGAIGIEVRRDLCRMYNRLLKRTIDLALAVPLAVLASPIVVALAIAIKRIDSGPAFYVQERVGRNGSKLQILKLRTMYADAEQRLEEHLHRDPQARAEWQRFFKLRNDPRVLPVIGDIMRRCSLDELPQLLNVIRGEMSLVGPRPFPVYHMESFDDEFRAVRVSVQPGLTGMWQVLSRSSGDLQVQKAQDLFYIRNWSIWLDIYILLETVIVVLSGKGAR